MQSVEVGRQQHYQRGSCRVRPSLMDECYEPRTFQKSANTTLEQYAIQVINKSSFVDKYVRMCRGRVVRALARHPASGRVFESCSNPVKVDSLKGHQNPHYDVFTL